MRGGDILFLIIRAIHKTVRVQCSKLFGGGTYLHASHAVDAE